MEAAVEDSSHGEKVFGKVDEHWEDFLDVGALKLCPAVIGNRRFCVLFG